MDTKEILSESSTEDTQKVEETDSEQSVETEDETTGTSESGDGKVEYYSAEELKSILESWQEADVNRIAPEMRPLYETIVKKAKEFQGDYTKKTQALAEERKRIEEERKRIQEQLAAAESPEARAFKEYMRDPVSFTARVNAEINRLELVPPYITGEGGVYVNPEYEKARKDIVTLRDYLHKFETAYRSVQETTNRANTLHAKAIAELSAEIPEYAKIAPELNRFIVESGVNEQLISILANPVVLDHICKTTGVPIDGVEASKMLTRFIHKVYTLAQAQKTGASKKSAPQVLTRSGGNTQEKTPAEMTDAEWIEAENARMLKKRRGG